MTNKEVIEEINWITEKCGTNTPPKEPPKARSVGNKIIIDSVDISGCKLYTAEFPLDINKCEHICNCTPCTYKMNWLQKQLRQEKKLNKVNIQRSLELNQELNNLQDELQREKQKNEELTQMINEAKNSDLTLSKILLCEEYQRDINKYQQALKEIGEICKNGKYDEYRMPLDEIELISSIVKEVTE